ncbi:MAG: hypothetical protein V4724_07980 [Pseudomonadota bacterium]
MHAFRLMLLAAWIAVLAVTAYALQAQGTAAGEIFMADIKALSWRAQFNTDFLAHLLVFAVWVAWRGRFRPAAVLLGAACVLGGGVFSMIYLFILSLLARGDATALLLGSRKAQATSAHSTGYTP